MAADLHISIVAEPIFSIGDFVITNSLFTSVLVTVLLISFAAFTRTRLLAYDKRPNGLQNFAEWIIESLYNLIYSVTNSKHKTHIFFPLVSTFFLFILLNNWLGLMPGVGTIVVDGIPIIRPGSADLNGTIALGIISVFVTQVFGVQFLSLGYFKKFINFSNPIMFFVGILEIVSEFAKVISFAFRLFGNIFAGEVLLVVIGSLIPLFLPIPFYGLEIFVGFIQALVFAMLSLVFFNMASQSHDH